MPVGVELELTRGGVPPARARRSSERISKLGERRDEAARATGRGARAATCSTRFRAAATSSRQATAVLEDPFGLERAQVDLRRRRRRPRLPAARRARPPLLRDRASRARRAAGCCCASPSGFDLHSVRDYEQGESLRRVHWRSTAQARAQLMVKELEDAPRDEVAVVLDATRTGRRPAAELRRCRCARPDRSCARTRAADRRAVLVVNGAPRGIRADAPRRRRLAARARAARGRGAGRLASRSWRCSSDEAGPALRARSSSSS